MTVLNSASCLGLILMLHSLKMKWGNWNIVSSLCSCYIRDVQMQKYKSCYHILLKMSDIVPTVAVSSPSHRQRALRSLHHSRWHSDLSLSQDSCFTKLWFLHSCLTFFFYQNHEIIVTAEFTAVIFGIKRRSKLSLLRPVISLVM